MKVNIILLAILIAQISSYSYDNINVCKCPKGKYWDFFNWKCHENPTKGSDNYVEGCEDYKLHRGAFSCVKCQPGYLFHDSTIQRDAYCEKTELDHCIDIFDKQSLNEYGIDSIKDIFNHRKLGKYMCDKCEKGYYWSGLQCIQYPQGPQDKGYLKRCSLYKINFFGQLACFDCENGYMLDGNECVKEPTCQPECGHYNYNARCVECKKKHYILDINGYCVPPDSFVVYCTNLDYLATVRDISHYCNECEYDTYPRKDGQKCVDFPNIGEIGYVENCGNYGYRYGNMIFSSSDKTFGCIDCQEGYYYNPYDNGCYKMDESSQLDNCKSYYGSESKGQFNLICNKCEKHYQLNKDYQCAQCPV